MNVAGDEAESEPGSSTGSTPESAEPTDPLAEAFTISVLGLPVAIHDVLSRAGVHSVLQLIRISDEDLIKVLEGQGIEPAAIAEIEACLASFLTSVFNSTDQVTRKSSVTTTKTTKSNFALPTTSESQATSALSSELRAESGSIELLQLSNRIFRALWRHYIRSISQLATLSESDLLQIRGIGPESIEEIKSGLTRYSALGQSGDGKLSPVVLTTAAITDRINTGSGTEMHLSLEHVPGVLSEESYEQLKGRLLELATRLCQPFQGESLLEELVIPLHVRQLIKEAIKEELLTLADIQRLVGQYPLQEKPDGLKSVRRARTLALERTVAWLEKTISYQTIDDEVDELLQCLSDRQRFILLNRFRPRQSLTLQTIGNRLGITRERVRQIEKKVPTRLSQRIEQLPLFYSLSALILFRRLGEDATLELWEQRLIDTGYLRHESAIDGLLLLGRVAQGSKLSLPRELTASLELGVPLDIIPYRKTILRDARRLCRNCGAVRAASLSSEALSETDVKQTLSIDGFTEIYPGWWAETYEGEWHVPQRIACKVIALCGPVSPPTMRHAVRRHLARSHFPAPPSEALVRILERTKEFVLVDGLLRFKDTPVKIPSLTGPEKIFVRIVQTEGPVVSFESLYGGLAREGFSIASHSKLLGESPIVQKVESGLYTLVGMPYDAVDIERAKHDLTRVSANYTMKPRSDGIMEFEVNVGNMTIYSGVLSCGPAVQMQGIWKTIVDGTQEGELLVKGHFIQKLESARDRLGLVPGDRIRIDFNTWTREATIRKVVIDEKA